MKYSYIVCDEKNRLVTLDVKMLGAVRSVVSIFENEQDALDVALAVEQISNVTHTVRRVHSSFTAADAPYGAQHV